MTTPTHVTTLLLFTLGSAACVAPATTPGPTHQWVATDVATAKEYNRDHVGCLSQAGISGATRRYNTEDDRFQDYTQCMNQRGYVLSAHIPETTEVPF